MHTHFERTLPVPTWVTLLALCSLVAMGVFAVARTVTDSNAAIPQGIARSGGDPAARVESNDAPGATAAAEARKPSRCPECGTIESIRRMDLARGSDRQGLDPRRAASSESGTPGAASATAAKIYEITVRLSNGKTMVLNEATPRAWRPGARVMVIGPVQVASR
jgi:hypothetical protein